MIKHGSDKNVKLIDKKEVDLKKKRYKSWNSKRAVSAPLMDVVSTARSQPTTSGEGVNNFSSTI